MTREQHSSTRFIEQLTWLRGLAALLVILSHVVRTTEVSFEPAAFNPGYVGVALFFVISGCVLYISNADNVAGKRNIFAFYIKRFFRIWPAYIVSLVVYMAFIPIFKSFYGAAHGQWIERQFLVDYSISDVLKYAALIFNFTGPVNFFNGAYWSLPIEFQYYLIFPLLILALRYMGTMGPLLIGFFVFFIPFFYFLDMRVELFALLFIFGGGIVLGYMTTKDFRRVGMAYGFSLLVFSLVAIAFIQMGYLKILFKHIPQLYPDPWVLYGFFAILAVFSVLVSKIHFPAKIEAFLKDYGEISYSTYLYHNLFIGIIVLITKHMEFDSPAMKEGLILLFAVTGSYIAAKTSYRYIEKPFIAYGHHISRSFLNKKIRAYSG